jgi:hypothetical protein
MRYYQGSEVLANVYFSLFILDRVGLALTAGPQLRTGPRLNYGNCGPLILYLFLLILKLEIRNKLFFFQIRKRIIDYNLEKFSIIIKIMILLLSFYEFNRELFLYKYVFIDYK